MLMPDVKQKALMMTEGRNKGLTLKTCGWMLLHTENCLFLTFLNCFFVIFLILKWLVICQNSARAFDDSF